MEKTAQDLLTEATDNNDQVILSWAKHQKEPLGAIEDIIMDFDVNSLEDLKYILTERLRDRARKLLEEAESSENPLIMLWLEELQKKGEEKALELSTKLIQEWGVENLKDLIYVLIETTRSNADRIMHQRKETIIIRKGEQRVA